MALDIKFSYICRKSFTDLSGDGLIKRYCQSCSKAVWNLDELSGPERENLIQRSLASGEELCVAATIAIENGQPCEAPSPERLLGVVITEPVDRSDLPSEEARETIARLQEELSRTLSMCASKQRELEEKQSELNDLLEKNLIIPKQVEDNPYASADQLKTALRKLRKEHDSNMREMKYVHDLQTFGEKKIAWEREQLRRLIESTISDRNLLRESLKTSQDKWRQEALRTLENEKLRELHEVQKTRFLWGGFIAGGVLMIVLRQIHPGDSPSITRPYELALIALFLCLGVAMRAKDQTPKIHAKYSALTSTLIETHKIEDSAQNK